MFRGIRTRLSRASVWGGAVLALSSLPLSAATFSAGAEAPCASPAPQTKLDAPVLVSTGFVQCVVSTTFVGQGIATGRADSGGIGVEAELLSGGIFTLAQGWGQIETTFIINGPGNEPIPVSINFELSGFLGGGTNLGVNIRTIENKLTG